MNEVPETNPLHDEMEKFLLEHRTIPTDIGGLYKYHQVYLLYFIGN